MSRPWLIVVALAAATATACAPAGIHYVYRGGVLRPPGQGVREERARLVLKLSGSRACRAMRANYDGWYPFNLSWDLHRRRVQVMLGPALQRLQGNMPVPLLRGIRRLHTTLAAAIGQGCVTPLAGRKLLRQVASSLALDPGLAQQIIFGAYATQEYIDIGGPVELGLTYALYPSEPTRYDLGYVARRYRFRSRDQHGRGWLELQATDVRDAPRPRDIPPAPIPLPVTGPPVYLRLFFYLRIAPNEHDVALVAARTHAGLAQATSVLRRHPRACVTLAVPGVRCIVAPEDDTLEARIAVRVQGRPEAVPLPGRVSQALAAAGVYDPDKVVATLRVLRPWHGRMIPVQAANGDALLQLVLSGGEAISW